MLGRPTALLTLALLVTAGCIAPSQPLDTAALPASLPVAEVRLLDDRAFEVEVPVRVVLVGFEPGTAEALQALLEPAHIDHDFLDATNTIADPQSAIALGTGLYTNPVLPIARYEVVAASAELEQRLLGFAAAAKVDGDGPALYDGRAFEDEVAAALQPRPETPVFVVLHGGDTLEAEHGWRYTYETGWLDRVRIFGGRLPVLVFDASAQADPYVSGGGGGVLGPVFGLLFGTPASRPAYEQPLERGGDATVEALAQAATDAAHYRILQGPIYPNSLRPCHTVLVYVGVRATAMAHRLGSADPSTMVDTATLAAGFMNLTGAPVTVEARVVQLPAEDPALDAATRNDLNYDLFRTWADMNWASFFQEDGCEHYLSTLLVTDAAEGVHGIALMDVQRNRRISFSWVDDMTRMTEEDGGALMGVPMLGGRQESRTTSRWATFLPSHETGHLFGQTHPHNAIRDQDVDGERAPSPGTFAFSATWDSMSYQAMDRVADFGAIAQANFQRNRAGFAVGAAVAQGLEGSPEFAQALTLLGQHRWKEASEVLLPVLDAEAAMASL